MSQKQKKIIIQIFKANQQVIGIFYRYRYNYYTKITVYRNTKSNYDLLTMTLSLKLLVPGLGGAWPSLHAYKKLNPAPKDDDEENNIFEVIKISRYLFFWYREFF